MIRSLIIFALFLHLSSLAQQESITYDQTQDISFAEKHKKNTKIYSYITKDGLSISVGDTLIIGNALIKGEKYFFDDVFSHIVIGNTKGVKNKEFKPLPHNYSGTQVVVKSFFVTHKRYSSFRLWPNRKKMPLRVSIFVRSSKNILSYNRKTILDIEKALSSGEIVNNNAPLSKEDAVKKLKDSKDLMELGFLSKEEYEKLKEKLRPIILD
jgi:hypothetical protein